MKKIEFPIKILMVLHSSGLTGPNKATVSLLKAMDKDKYKVDVACPRDGDLSKVLREAGIFRVPLEFGRNRDILTAIDLIRILKRNNYHVLHGHMGRVGPMICASGKMAGVPAIILTEHMNDSSHTWMREDKLRLRIHHLFHMLSNSILDRVIAVSECARISYIARQGMREDKVVTIYNSTRIMEDHRVLDDSARTSLREELRFGENTLVVGTVGRLIKEKGHEDVVMAGRRVLHKYPEARFLVVGDGPQRAYLEALARKEGLADKCIFLGFRRDMDDVMRAIDILVQPTHRECPESFGLVLIEAMARRKAVIASDIEPFREIIKDGENGLLFSEKDVTALADKLTILLEDRAIVRLLAERAFCVVKERFNPESAARKTEELYSDILRSKGYDLTEYA